MNRLNLICILSAIFAFCIIPTQSNAQSQSNFVVSPSPIPWHEFQKGQTDLKLGGNYVSVSAEDDIDISGAGLNVSARYAFQDMVALDFMFNYMYIAGYTGNSDFIEVNFISWNPNMEFQPVKNEKFNLILFGGLMWTLVPVSYEPVNDEPISATASMSGIQFGVQGVMKTGNFAISPFFLYQSLSGSVEITGYGSADIPTQTVKTFGFDIAYVPYSTTLSGLLQSVTDNSKFKVYYLALGYDFQWGGPESNSSEPAAAPEPVKKGK
ncbi:MAG: hypothetical protein ACRCUT_14130 [Spirochaetota bacterium]